MAIILLHSSKTMRPSAITYGPYHPPQLLRKAAKLAAYVATLSSKELEKPMHLSSSLAVQTQELLNHWSATPNTFMPAIDAFLGDIYSGLQVAQLTEKERIYANEHLYILSGLYGLLKPLDSISPYRLEMGYRFTDEPFKNLYKYWGNTIARALPSDELVVNLSAVEYTKAVLPYLSNRNVISPKFLTIDQRTNEPKFVVVHAKIARGAFARWMIINKVDNLARMKKFTDLNYRYSDSLSSVHEPVYICKTFGGLGLSVRLGN